MVEAKLTINGKEFPIHYLLLKSIAENLPEGEGYADLARALLALNIESITSELLDRDVLTTEELDAIWESGTIGLRRSLADLNKFRINLTDRQADQIIELDDKEILKSIASWSEVLYPDEDGEQAMRLSGKMADKLLQFISTHPDAEVRRELIENSGTPAKFRPSMTECLESGILFLRRGLANFQEDDLAILQRLPLSALAGIASSVEDITNRKTQNKVIDFLCSYPDPQVRMRLAENSLAPRSAHEKLAKDEDADVASEARKQLGED